VETFGDGELTGCGGAMIRVVRRKEIEMKITISRTTNEAIIRIRLILA